MLKTRVITALVIFSITLVALFLLPNYGWAFFTLLVMAAASWEWSRFCRLSKGATRVYNLASVLLSSMIFISYHQGQFGDIPFSSLALAGFLVAAIFWMLVVPVWLLKIWQPASGWVIALADMPSIRIETLVAVIDALRGGARIAVPAMGGKRGHPVGFSALYRARLQALTGDIGAREILKADANYVEEISVDDAGIFADIDTPADLKR